MVITRPFANVVKMLLNCSLIHLLSMKPHELSNRNRVDYRNAIIEPLNISTGEVSSLNINMLNNSLPSLTGYQLNWLASCWHISSWCKSSHKFSRRSHIWLHWYLAITFLAVRISRRQLKKTIISPATSWNFTVFTQLISEIS